MIKKIKKKWYDFKILLSYYILFSTFFIAFCYKWIYVRSFLNSLDILLIIFILDILLLLLIISRINIVKCLTTYNYVITVQFYFDLL